MVLPVLAQTTTIPPGSSTSASGAVVIQLCSIVLAVRTIVGVMALTMFLMGAILYSIGHFLPVAGQVKASMQGWSMGMIMGGIIGVILVIIAPFIITTLINFGSGLTALQC